MNERIPHAIWTTSLSLAIALGAASCGGSAPAAPEVPEAGGPGADGPAMDEPAADEGAKVAWVDMDMDQKKKHMMAEVTPHMAGVFQAFDGERYAKFDCSTCHGPGAQSGEFAMPSPALPKLPPNGDFAALKEKKPEIMEFMFKVGPEMAGTIGAKPYDPSTNEGFSCYGCHQSE